MLRCFGWCSFKTLGAWRSRNYWVRKYLYEQFKPWRSNKFAVVIHGPLWRKEGSKAWNESSIKSSGHKTNSALSAQSNGPPQSISKNSPHELLLNVGLSTSNNCRIVWTITKRVPHDYKKQYHRCWYWRRQVYERCTWHVYDSVA